MKSREPIAHPPPGRFVIAADGAFELDTRLQRLTTADGTRVALPPRALELLALLAAHAGELLERQALIDALWPDVVVDDNNLSQLVVLLRRALGDSGAGRWIQTVPRRGFRLLAAVRTVATPGAAATARGPGSPQALAVLPFKPLSAAQQDEVLQMGLADTLVTRLSAVPGLAVRAIGSVRRFGALDADPLSAARVLAVDWILDGTVQRRNGRLRGSARLLRAADGTASWSDVFDESDDDLFKAQEAIARRVVAVVAPQLGGLPGPAPAPVQSDAMQLYLAARLHAQGVDGAGLDRSTRLFEQAIAAWPSFALAHAGLSETARRSVFGADADPRIALPRARAAAERAVALDPALAQGHSTLGWCAFWHDRDWPRAEALFQHAIALNANVPEAQLGLGHLLMCTGRPLEALGPLAQARLADPLSPLVNTMEATGLAAVGRQEEAKTRLARALDIDADFWVALLMRGGMQAGANAWDEAVATFERAVTASGGRVQAVAALASALARAGRTDGAKHHLRMLRERAAHHWVAPTALARIHTALGDHGAALDQLEAAATCRDVSIAYLAAGAWRYPALESEPRHAALLRRLGLALP